MRNDHISSPNPPGCPRETGGESDSGGAEPQEDPRGTRNRYTEGERLLYLQWIQRFEDAFATKGKRQAWFHTLTFAQEPSEREARKYVQKWLAKLRVLVKQQKAAREYLLATEPFNDIERRKLHREWWEDTLHYVVVFERGEKNGRLHAHVITLTPHQVRHRQWQALWKCGFSQHKLVDLADLGSAYYLCKYITKQNGRTLCSSTFGSARMMILLSSVSYRLLTIHNLKQAQRLYQRLSLTRNYPTSKWIKRWVSSDRLLTTLRQYNNRLWMKKMTGATCSGPASSRESDIAQANYRATKRLIREVIQDLRKAHTNPSCARFVERAFPGLYTFGKPRPALPARLAAEDPTAIYQVQTANFLRARRAPAVAKIQVRR